MNTNPVLREIINRLDRIERALDAQRPYSPVGEAEAILAAEERRPRLADDTWLPKWVQED
jgi:hypothetical protein